MTSWSHKASCHLHLWLMSAVKCHWMSWRAESLGFSLWYLCWTLSQGYTPPMVQSSCLGHLLPWSHSCFKVFWGVIFWLRTYSINYICLRDFSLHCPREYVLISVLPAVVKLSHSCISEVAYFSAGELQYVYNNGLYYHCKQERCWLSLLQAGLVVICPTAFYGVASPLFVSSQPILCAPQAEADLQEQYFQPLVKKEELEEKMRNIKAVKCRVVTCKTVSEGEPGLPAGEWNMVLQNGAGLSCRLPICHCWLWSRDWCFVPFACFWEQPVHRVTETWQDFSAVLNISAQCLCQWFHGYCCPEFLYRFYEVLCTRDPQFPIFHVKNKQSPWKH